ncbi:MAG: GNAT family N-acetyltransferase [Microbacterium sp.]|uniref:GNAT family N-acetyltransferase n=1 Tax=Microbacterium sp. TaxID=51671 RepID=UPI0039E5C54C
MPRVRPASVEEPDAHALLTDYFALRAETFPGGAYRTVFPDPATFTEPAGVFVVLEDDEHGVVGCGGIRRLDAARWEVKHLFVRPTGRGRGWGRMLLADLEQRARAAGAAELVLDTHHSLSAAAALYASAGFTPIEPYNDNPNATRWFAKRID